MIFLYEILDIGYYNDQCIYKQHLIIYNAVIYFLKVRIIIMKILFLLLTILLSGCVTTPQVNQINQTHKNCGFRIGISQYSSTGMYFDYNCNTYQSY